VFKILSLDGGGIKGVFEASFLTAVQRAVPSPLASYFDLIAGTSTGGINCNRVGTRAEPSRSLGVLQIVRPADF
jgi:patatin-like phospholipase/acyl hydrolase